MWITATADLHGFLPKPEELPAGDVLVLAGDVCPDFSVYAPDNVIEQTEWLEYALAPWAESLPFNHIILIGGNHDFALQQEIDHSEYPWTYLEDEAVTIDGVKFYGTPWVPNLPSWAFYASSHGLNIVFDQIPDDVDVLISHGPPYGIRDRAPRRGIPTAGPNVGSPELRDAIIAKSPSAVICGHIHGDYGQDPLGDTEVYNVARCTEGYSPTQPIWSLVV